MLKRLAEILKAIPITKIIMIIARVVLPMLGLGGWVVVLAKWFGLPLLENEIQKAEDAVDSELGKYVDRSNVHEGVQDVEQKHDQTKLEESIGSDNAGKPAEDREGVHSRDPIH